MTFIEVLHGELKLVYNDETIMTTLLQIRDNPKFNEPGFMRGFLTRYFEKIEVAEEILEILIRTLDPSRENRWLYKCINVDDEACNCSKELDPKSSRSIECYLKHKGKFVEEIPENLNGMVGPHGNKGELTIEQEDVNAVLGLPSYFPGWMAEYPAAKIDSMRSCELLRETYDRDRLLGLVKNAKKGLKMMKTEAHRLARRIEALIDNSNAGALGRSLVLWMDRMKKIGADIGFTLTERIWTSNLAKIDEGNLYIAKRLQDLSKLGMTGCFDGAPFHPEIAKARKLYDEAEALEADRIAQLPSEF